jgi:hypothetical protein
LEIEFVQTLPCFGAFKRKIEAYREAVGILLAQRFVAIVADKLQ